MDNTLIQNDHRKDLINRWLRDVLKQADFTLTELSGDASFRRYFRLKHANSLRIVMDAPPEKEPLGPFISCRNRLNRQGVDVPNIYSQNLDLGVLVLSDFGHNDYQSSMRAENARNLYKNAIDSIIKIQSDQDITALPIFDASHIHGELELFDNWFLSQHHGINNSPLKQTYDYLIDEVCSQPYAAIHRDYHSRNLMVLKDNQPGILDFQDMMQGPVSYDLVSLLKDCYVDLDPFFANSMKDYFLEHSPLKCDNFTHYFTLTGIQRHLKALGIFARLAYRDKNPNYLQYLPRTLTYIKDVADNHPKLQPLSELIKTLS